MKLSREQIRSNIFVQFKNNKTAREAKAELDMALGTSAPSRATVFNWYGRFRSGKQDVQDEARKGRPKSAVTAENIDAVKAMCDSDGNSTYTNIQGILNIGSHAVNVILKHELKGRKLVSQWLPHDLTKKQKEDRVAWCQMMKRIYVGGNSRHVSNIVTADETWISFREPKTKQGNKSWTFQNQPLPTQIRPSRWVHKRMFALFFRKTGFVSLRMLRKGETVTAKWYKQTLIEMFKKIRKQRPKTGLRHLVFHQDNASSHSSLVKKGFFQQQNVALTGHPVHSPDLAPLDFFYNNEIKKKLRGQKFLTENALVRAIKNSILCITKAQHTSCFNNWFIRMDKCIAAGGEYFEKI